MCEIIFIKNRDLLLYETDLDFSFAFAVPLRNNLKLHPYHALAFAGAGVFSLLVVRWQCGVRRVKSGVAEIAERFDYRICFTFITLIAQQKILIYRDVRQ